MTSIQTVSIFCGSSKGNDPAYAQEMRLLGKLLGENGIHVFYGGNTGKDGLLDILHDTVTEAGGKMTAFISRAYHRSDVLHHQNVKVFVVNDEFERGQKLLQTDGIIIGPGSIGSFGEGWLAVSSNLSRTYQGLPVIPTVFMNVPTSAMPQGQFAKIPLLVDDFISAGFSKPEASKLFTMAPDAANAFSILRASASTQPVLLDSLSSVIAPT